MEEKRPKCLTIKISPLRELCSPHGIRTRYSGLRDRRLKPICPEGHQNIPVTFLKSIVYGFEPSPRAFKTRALTI